MTVHAGRQPGKGSWYSDWAMGWMMCVSNSGLGAPVSLYSVHTWFPPLQLAKVVVE